MCAEGMDCGRKWVIWVLQGTGLPVGLQECLISVGRLFQNGTARTSLFVELIGAAA